MDAEVNNCMDYIRFQYEHLQPDEYITLLEDLIAELEIERDAIRDGA